MSLVDSRQEGDLITIRRDNVVLDVPADQKSYYMGLGYNVINESGAVIEETVPTDIATLQRYYKDASKKITELEAEIKALKSQKKEKSEKTEAVVTNLDEVAVQPVTRGRRRNKS